MKAKKIFSFIAAFCMIFAMVPANAFAATNVTITVGDSPGDCSNLSGGGTYSVGSSVTLTATPLSTDYTFE